MSLADIQSNSFLQLIQFCMNVSDSLVCYYFDTVEKPEKNRMKRSTKLKKYIIINGKIALYAYKSLQ